jgi:putative sigma-54 modulation protein
MKTQVQFRHLKSTQELQDAANEAVQKFEKFYDRIISSDITFINETDTNKVVEITVHIHGTTLVAKETSDDFFKSLNEAADKIIRQLRKKKTKDTKVIPIEE